MGNTSDPSGLSVSKISSLVRYPFIVLLARWFSITSLGKIHTMHERIESDTCSLVIVDRVPVLRLLSMPLHTALQAYQMKPSRFCWRICSDGSLADDSGSGTGSTSKAEITLLRISSDLCLPREMAALWWLMTQWRFEYPESGPDAIRWLVWGRASGEGVVKSPRVCCWFLVGISSTI